MFGWLRKKKPKHAIVTAVPASSDDGFVQSVALGYATNDGLVGGLLGGNLAGGMLGDMMNTSEDHHCHQTPEVDSGAGSYDSSSYDSGGSSYDSGSYDSGSSFDSGSCGGDF
jgi:hypothetical protein